MVFVLVFFLKGTSKSDKCGSWFESDLGTKHVVENHLLGFTEAENQFASYKGGCYLCCAYYCPCQSIISVASWLKILSSLMKFSSFSQMLSKSIAI